MTKIATRDSSENLPENPVRPGLKLLLIVFEFMVQETSGV